MRLMGVAALWCALATGCATTRVVNLEVGQGQRRAFTPVESEPVEVDEDDFKAAVTRLVLDLRLDVTSKDEAQDGRYSLLASSGQLVDGVKGQRVATTYERICMRQDDPESCLRLTSAGLTLELGAMERRMLALSFALDAVWDGVEEAIRDVANPAVLRVMVTTMIGTTLLMLVAPEPLTKVIAVALTASLIAYLGTGPVWNLGRGFLLLMSEAGAAKDFVALHDAGHRFGKVLGDNGARVLVLVALSALGGRAAMASQGPRLPGFAQAATRAELEGGFQLAAAWAGEVQAISVSSASVLNIALAPTAVAAVAMGPGTGPGGIQGDPDGNVHHICTDKNTVSDSNGGPWTPEFERIFGKADMKLSDPENLVRIRGHQGPHPREYHEKVFKLIDSATKGCRSPAQCRVALTQALAKIARELVREGTKLRNLISSGAGE
ncbi:AHH domain-containing protein [Myxococcus sp. K15C18031901]|uniref:AHH domain-containing protein n=1 Tax=Myxococcus dinghuensis TaxID=2906761 RepID=UPI0020A712AB|nr:AHH domain-containing protein [Myxococcus dinghuensis]MCP3099863.1 AHH domain-containing protein [Myxococcus dinghuensis]